MKTLIVQTIVFMSLLLLPLGTVSAESMLKDPVKQIETVLKKSCFKNDPASAERLVMDKADESDAINTFIEMGYTGKIGISGGVYLLPDKKGMVNIVLPKGGTDAAIINIDIPGIKIKRITFKK